MAQIAEDLFLLLVDNASAQPGLDRARRERVLTAAVLLDLARACLIRPAVAGEPVAAGKLVALRGGAPVDAVGEPAWRLLQRRPLRPAVALSKLRKHTEDNLVAHLERTGQLRRVRLKHTGMTHPYALPLTDRHRVGQARSDLLAALFEGRPPTAPTAAIISVLHAVDGLGALLSLNDRGWRWVHGRAGEIASGSWVDESPTGLAEVNVAITASALRSALNQ
ncbi:MAG: GPP34 family phosphoprotein [Actinobacteria bacterium]|nr:GPP34 family phosphoprotein [Actinomycetota bacterium]